MTHLDTLVPFLIYYRSYIPKRQVTITKCLFTYAKNHAIKIIQKILVIFWNIRIAQCKFTAHVLRLGGWWLRWAGKFNKDIIYIDCIYTTNKHLPVRHTQV